LPAREARFKFWRMVARRRLYVARTKVESGAVSDSGAIRSRKVRRLNGESRFPARLARNPLILRGPQMPFRPGMKQLGKIRPERLLGRAAILFVESASPIALLRRVGRLDRKIFRPPRKPEPLA
jgi:hypothetical protein